ncbi:hypothetical protein BC827DRAFT_1267012 [Russula dissimulans]|nr:hypothetical protein BC827DRAFT_1267012 [Russula dissimulans]
MKTKLALRSMRSTHMYVSPFCHVYTTHEEKLQPSLTRFFRHLSRSPTSSLERHNWLIQVPPLTPAPALASSPAPSPLEAFSWAEGSMFGPEDMLGTAPRTTSAGEDARARRAPDVKAIVFTIRVYLTLLAELGPGDTRRARGGGRF